MIREIIIKPGPMTRDGVRLPVKLAVVGAGGIAQLVHIPAAQRVVGGELVALCDVSEKVAQVVAGKYCVPAYYTDAQVMYDEEDVDAVLVLTSHAQHKDATIQAAENGKHVMVEKPMAMTSGDCNEMVAACRKAKVRLMLAFMKRFDPSLQWIKERICSGDLGDLFVVNSWYCDSVHHMEYVKGFISSFTKSDAVFPPMQVDRHKELLLGHGVHHMDLLHWIGGDVRSMTTRYRELARNAFVSNSIVEYVSGSSGYFQLAGVLARDWTEGIQVHGTEGSAEADILFPYFRKPSPVQVYTAKRRTYETLTHPYRDQYLGEIQHFVDSINQGFKPSPSGEDGLYAQRMVEAAHLSSSVEKTVLL